MSGERAEGRKDIEKGGGQQKLIVRERRDRGREREIERETEREREILLISGWECERGRKELYLPNTLCSETN